MKADIKRHRSGSGSSVWIDPAYMRNSFVSARQQPPQDDASAASPSSHSPIPRRASGPNLRAPGVRPRKYLASSLRDDNDDITRLPTLPRSGASQQGSPVWQYDSPAYEIESSIASLSLVVADQPTRPEAPSANTPPPDVSLFVADQPTHPEPPRVVKHRRETVRLSDPEVSLWPEPMTPQDVSIDQIDTIPASVLVLPTPLSHAAASRSAQLHDSLTVPGQALIVRESLAPASIEQDGMVSWTAGGAQASLLARRIADSSREKSRYPRPRQPQSMHVRFNPFDQARWWLLHPGRIEFILWLAGTVLLIAVTCIFLFTTALSFGWITTGSLTRFVSSPASSTTQQNQNPLPTVAIYPGLKLVLLNQGPLMAGQTIRLHGAGFTARGRVSFTYDDWQPFPALQGMPNSIQADANGSFTTTLLTGTGLAWLPGLHMIEAKDLSTGHETAIPCSLAQGPIGKGKTPRGTATANPVTSGSTPTPASGTPGTGSGTIPTPVGQTPVPFTPTPTQPVTPTPTQPVTPTPTQPPATPTPTPPTATPGITPTVGNSSTPDTSSDATGTSGTIASFSAALLVSKTPIAWGPWLWLLIAGYTLVMLLIGLAGVLHKRRQ